jgi:hypothetical protein
MASRCSADCAVDACVFLYAFDLIELNGVDRREPIEARKGTLARILRRAKPGLKLSEHICEPGDPVFQAACLLGCEGIISKRLGSRYRFGRSSDWVKFKNFHAPAVKREAGEEGTGCLARLAALHVVSSRDHQVKGQRTFWQSRSRTRAAASATRSWRSRLRPTRAKALIR